MSLPNGWEKEAGLGHWATVLWLSLRGYLVDRVLDKEPGTKHRSLRFLRSLVFCQGN